MWRTENPEGWAGLVATNVELEDLLGPDVRFLSATSPFAACSPRGNGYRCTLPAIPPGTEIPIAVRIRLDDGGDMLTISDARVAATQAGRRTPGSNAQQIVAERGRAARLHHRHRSAAGSSDCERRRALPPGRPIRSDHRLADAARRDRRRHA